MHRRFVHTLDQLDERLAAAGAGHQVSGSRLAGLRRGAATFGGLALILAGVPMLVLPGPGVLAILLGLSILAGQFPWARWLLASVTLWLR